MYTLDIRGITRPGFKWKLYPIVILVIVVVIIVIWLVVLTILKIIGQWVNGKDYPIYEMENNIHVPNHQPAVVIVLVFVISPVPGSASDALGMQMAEVFRT